MIDRRGPMGWKVLAALLAALLAVGLLAGCGGGGSDAKDTTTTTENAAARKVELSKGLLVPADLATGDSLDVGWELGDVTKGVDITLPACLVEAPVAGALATTTTKLVTKNDLHLPSLEEDVSAYPAGGSAKAFAAAVARLDDCRPDFVFQGTPSAGSIDRLPLTLGGEQAAAWRTSVTIAGASVAVTTIQIQHGDEVVSLVHTEIGSPDETLLEGFASKALAKLS